MAEIFDLNRLTNAQATRRIVRLFDEGRFQPMPAAIDKLQRRRFDLGDVQSVIHAGRVLARREQDEGVPYEFEGVTFDGFLLRLLFDIREIARLVDVLKTRKRRR